MEVNKWGLGSVWIRYLFFMIFGATIIPMASWAALSIINLEVFPLHFYGLFFSDSFLISMMKWIFSLFIFPGFFVLFILPGKKKSSKPSVKTEAEKSDSKTNDINEKDSIVINECRLA
jgi:hypothetical protein